MSERSLKLIVVNLLPRSGHKRGQFAVGLLEVRSDPKQLLLVERQPGRPVERCFRDLSEKASNVAVSTTSMTWWLLPRGQQLAQRGHHLGRDVRGLPELLEEAVSDLFLELRHAEFSSPCTQRTLGITGGAQRRPLHAVVRQPPRRHWSLIPFRIRQTLR